MRRTRGGGYGGWCTRGYGVPGHGRSLVPHRGMGPGGRLLRHTRQSGPRVADSSDIHDKVVPRVPSTAEMAVRVVLRVPSTAGMAVRVVPWRNQGEGPKTEKMVENGRKSEENGENHENQ